MTEFAVKRVGSTIIVASPTGRSTPEPPRDSVEPPARPPTPEPSLDVAVVRPHPERTALIEARGALLYWDVLEPQTHPAAEIHDPDLAADWLWEIYGPEAAAAILSGADSVTTEMESLVLDAARKLAHLRWAEAWWPSSHVVTLSALAVGGPRARAGLPSSYQAVIPALSRGLLRAEAAFHTAEVEHLLDDEEAVERALDFDPAAMTALESHLVLGSDARILAEDLAELAEDYGVVLRTAPAPARPEDWALAAGGESGGGLALADGEVPVDWASVPQGLVDTAGLAHWSLTQRGGATVIAVEVPAAPKARGAALTARIGGAEITLHHDRDTGLFIGEAEAPQGFLMLPTSQRVLHVYDPAFATGDAATDPDATARRDALIVYAYQRIFAPDACLAVEAAVIGIDLP